MPHLPVLGQYLGHTWGFDHESRPDGGAFDHDNQVLWWGQMGDLISICGPLSVAKAGSGLVVQQHLVVGYKACTSYMQLLLPYHHNTSTANY